MIIKEIEYRNFRQFKDHGSLRCSSNGKLTIIYGKNGDGKTTLHQLFHWIFYNSVNFNKTTTDKLYNLYYETALRYNETTETEGKITFEHNGFDYSIRRVWHYQKQVSKIAKIGEEVELYKLNENNDWKKITQNNKEVTKIMEEILPSGLSEYFFFDGESMIADLKVKSGQAANNLKKALFIIFNLAYLDMSIKHIGNTDRRSTVIGTLYSNKGNTSNNVDTQRANENRLNAENNVEQCENKITELNEMLKNNSKRMENISEEIGSALSNVEYEEKRKSAKKHITELEKNISDEKINFGKDIYSFYPKLLVKKRFEYAKKAIKDNLEKDGNEIPIGLEKDLINTLLSLERKTCICGNIIGSKERIELKKYLLLFPPYSHKDLYFRLEKMFDKVGANNLELSLFTEHFRKIFSYKEKIQLFDKEIDDLDKKMKKYDGLQHLVNERIKLEERNEQISQEISKFDQKLGLFKVIYRQEKNKYEKSILDNKNNRIIDEKIHLMEMIKQLLEKELDQMSEKYSQQFKYNIEYLLENMLTSKRHVDVNKDFHVRVFDSFDDESKSEGQFAVVSFAYIGAILKLLKEEDALRNKEYPLVLDGPFSKLDEDQRQNVINVIPKFAPQIILFSKDGLNDYIDDNMIGKVWTIKSNEEKNLSYCEEGYLWD